MDLTVQPGQILGVVGESGCGETVTALSILRLIQKHGRVAFAIPARSLAVRWKPPQRDSGPVDSRLAAGRSTAVQGELPADTALQTVLQGTA